MPESTFYLELDPESQRALSENDITIEDVLRQAHIDAKVFHGVAPYAAQDGGKELATIIIAAGMSAVMVASGIAKVLQIYLSRPRVVELSNVVEIRDKNGEVLTDAAGRPRFKLEKRLEMAQPQQPIGLTDLDSNLGALGHIRFRSKG